MIFTTTKSYVTNASLSRAFQLLCALFFGNFGITMSSAPFLRNGLAKAMYNKMMDDRCHKTSSHQSWYIVDTKNLSPPLSDKFIKCHQDAETSQFLDNCYEKSDWVFTQITHMMCRSLLSWFMTKTSINGYLQRGSMFIFSSEQLQKLLKVSHDWKTDNLLDLGAGDGRVTEVMAHHANHTFVTEVSPVMQRRLRERGYSVLGIDDWSDGSRQYDLIGCLNLIDRCDKPITMLHSMKQSLRPLTGRIILAVVLPFKPYVEADFVDHMPSENLHIYGKTFEDQVSSLIANVFSPAGFCVESFTRLPYLCEGDLTTSFFVLTDAVFVLKLCNDSLTI